MGSVSVENEKSRSREAGRPRERDKAVKSAWSGMPTWGSAVVKGQRGTHSALHLPCSSYLPSFQIPAWRRESRRESLRRAPGYIFFSYSLKTRIYWIFETEISIMIRNVLNTN